MSKRGEMFKRIFTLLEEGYSAAEIVKMGYSESTVYWAAGRRSKGERPQVNPGEQQDWVTTGLEAGWIHRCEDGGLGIVEQEDTETTEGVFKELVCFRCKKVTSSTFEKWTPPGKESYLLNKPAPNNITSRLQMKALP